MAELGKMTVTELVSKVLSDEHGDALKEAVAYLADALMEAEVEAQAGARYRERSPERKAGATATGSGAGRPEWVRSNWPSPSSARGPTSPASWSRGAGASRPSSPASRRPT